jgi:hypothetical protein
MNIRFYIDPETDEPHVRGHGVDEAEAEDVLRAPLEDRPVRMAHASRLVRPVPDGIVESSTLPIPNRTAYSASPHTMSLPRPCKRCVVGAGRSHELISLS